MDNDHPRARLYYLFGTANHPRGSSWLERFPASLFGIPVGLFGLAGAWRRAAAFGWGIAEDIAPLLLWTAVALWAAGLLVYAFKCKRHWASVLREFRHPVHGPLQALLPLATLLAVVHFGTTAPLAWLPVCLVALLLNGILAYRVFATAAIGQLASNAVTPALYLPVVGGMLVGAMALATLHHAGWAAVLFGAGMAGWAVLEARVLNGMFKGPLPESFRPTIGIELAPPVIATLAAAVIWPELPGMVLGIGIGAAVVPFASILARYSWWSQVPFSSGFWSFSFPAAALASVVLETVHREGWPIWIGHVVLLTSTVIIGLLGLRTLILLAQRKLLPPA